MQAAPMDRAREGSIVALSPNDSAFVHSVQDGPCSPDFEAQSCFLKPVTLRVDHRSSSSQNAAS